MGSALLILFFGLVFVSRWNAIRSANTKLESMEDCTASQCLDVRPIQVVKIKDSGTTWCVMKVGIAWRSWRAQPCLKNERTLVRFTDASSCLYKARLKAK